MTRLPLQCEIDQWLLSTVQHVFHIEYFLQRLQIGNNTPQRPHDIMGIGNKFEWDIIKGLSLQYAHNGEEIYKDDIWKSIALHQQQYHHQMWDKLNPKATNNDMELGAVDSICSLLEDRQYQGGAHTFQEIEDMIGTRCAPHALKWLRQVLPEMRKLDQPHLNKITLTTFPNIGVSPEIYDMIDERLHETKKMLNERGYRFVEL